MPTTLLCHINYTHRKNCTKTWISLCGFWSNWDFPTLWPVGKYRLDLIGDEPQKNIGQDICKKYWQGLIGDEPQKILAKIFAKKNWQGLIGDEFQTDRKWLCAVRSGYGCSFSVQLLEAYSPVEVVWTGRGGEWSSAKGLVAHCCNLFSASISSSELPIEVFSSFGTTRIICWPLFLQQEPLVLQPCG